MERIWRIAPHDESYVRNLTHSLKISPLLAQVLAARGHEQPAAALQFLTTKLADLHDPETMPGISAAADRVVAAVQASRRITVYGDYDVDGVTATSVLWHCLQLAGAKVDYYIPSRMEEGYGLNAEAIRQLHAEDPQRLLITVDCGITSVHEAQVARELGLELVITDHHQFQEQLPAADVLVHPRLPGGNYPFGDLCGVGVAFKLAWAICVRLGDGKKATPRMREFLLGAIGLTAIGTIADVVPLVGENRVLVQYGLASLLDRAQPGLRALLSVAKLKDRNELQAEDLAFGVAPRINAAGRLGQARLAVECLTTDNERRAAELANYLQELNLNRQTVERRMIRQAKELIAENPDWADHAALVVAHPEWHPGVIGIVAGRLAEQFHRPAIAIALGTDQDFAQGSCRTFAGFNLHTALNACRDHLQTFGGHPAAAGLKIRPAAIDEFRSAFAAHVAEHHTDKVNQAAIRVDAEVRLADITPRAVIDLQRLGPFGASNPRPILMATQVELSSPPKKMGDGERHLSLQVRQFGNVKRAVAFGKADWADQLAEVDGPIAIVFQPVVNRFNGMERAELQVMDWKPATLLPATSQISPARDGE